MSNQYRDKYDKVFSNRSILTSTLCAKTRYQWVNGVIKEAGEVGYYGWEVHEIWSFPVLDISRPSDIAVDITE